MLELHIVTLTNEFNMTHGISFFDFLSSKKRQVYAHLPLAVRGAYTKNRTNLPDSAVFWLRCAKISFMAIRSLTPIIHIEKRIKGGKKNSSLEKTPF